MKRKNRGMHPLKEKQKEMETKYSKWHKKIKSLESQLSLIITNSLESPTPQPPPYDLAVEEFNKEIHFLKKFLTAEKASISNPTHDLNQMVRRVKIMQKGLRAWTNIRYRPTSSEPINTDSCLEGYKMYENPEYDQHEETEVWVREEEEEAAVTEEVEGIIEKEEMIRVFNQKIKTDFRVIFGVFVIVIVAISVSKFSEYHSLAVFLTPT